MLLELTARGLGLKLRVRGFKGVGFLRQGLESARHAQIFRVVSCAMADRCDLLPFYRLDVGWWEVPHVESKGPPFNILKSTMSTHTALNPKPQTLNPKVLVSSPRLCFEFVTRTCPRPTPTKSDLRAANGSHVRVRFLSVFTAVPIPESNLV